MDFLGRTFEAKEVRTISSFTGVPLYGYPDYLVNTNGEIRRIGSHRMMKGLVNRNGYRQYTLTKDGESSTKEAHRLILLSFHPISNCKNKHTNHKNGVKTDNSIENLEWVSPSENTKHSYRTKLQTNVTNRHGNYRVLTECDLKEIKHLHLSKYLDREIAERFGCSRTLISRKIREMGLRK